MEKEIPTEIIPEEEAAGKTVARPQPVETNIVYQPLRNEDKIRQAFRRRSLGLIGLKGKLKKSPYQNQEIT